MAPIGLAGLPGPWLNGARDQPALRQPADRFDFVHANPRDASSSARPAGKTKGRAPFGTRPLGDF